VTRGNPPQRLFSICAIGDGQATGLCRTSLAPRQMLAREDRELPLRPQRFPFGR
jgi:hypothetical protein